MVYHKIICGDCIEVLKNIEEESIDLIITSPPYNIGIEYDKWNDKMMWNDYWIFTKNWLNGCFKVLKKDGRICINHYFSFGYGEQGRNDGIKQENNQFNNKSESTRIAPLFEIHRLSMDIGFKHHSVAVWPDRTLAKKTAWGSWLSASSPYINSPFEGILIMYKQSWKKFSKGESDIEKREFADLTRGIWDIGTQSKQIGKSNFPVSLPSKCIKLLSYKDDLILDPFLGSGTTLIACEKLNRNGLGMEISKEYCKLSYQRLQKEVNQLKFGREKSIIKKVDF
jgi:site-specific DNA-methyltransferase (adenine-specific)